MSKVISKLLLKKQVVTSALIGAAAITALVPTMAFATTFASDSDLRLSGSTTVYPIVAAALGIDGDSGGSSTDGDFQEENGNLKAELYLGGSTVGKQDARDQVNDLGMASSSIGSSYPTLIEKKIARDAVCLVVNSQVTGVSTLTLTQIKGIYEGTIDNWNEVGGPNQPIAVLGRAVTSGTRESLLHFAGITTASELTTVGTNRYDSNNELKNAVNGTAYSIGYVGLGYANTFSSSQVLKVGGIKANAQNCTTNNTLKKYPMSRYLYIEQIDQDSVTDDEVIANRGNANNFINFLLSRTSQHEYVEAQGFVQLTPAQDVNNDKRISISDVAKVGSKYGQQGFEAGSIVEDLNWDGKVNISDIASVGAWYGIAYD